MHYLLDVNVLVAWGWSDHGDHRRAAKWIGRMMGSGDVTLVTSAIPQLGFVRVSVQRTGGRIPVTAAAEVLSGLLETLGPGICFWRMTSHRSRPGRTGVFHRQRRRTPIWRNWRSVTDFNSQRWMKESPEHF